MKVPLIDNNNRRGIIFNTLLAAVSLFVNGFGVYLTIHAGIGAAPWDAFNLGISNTTGITYGNASVAVSVLILVIDILLREPIGIAMFCDAVIVGKTVDLFNYLDIIPAPKNYIDGVFMMILGILIIGYTCAFYMLASLGCGPRDTLLVGLKKRLTKIPIGLVSIMLLCVVTLIGWLLGGKVGVGTLICAFGIGPSLQLAFFTLRFDADKVEHQDVIQSIKIFFQKAKK